MNYLANKAISFEVVRYEEWSGGRCLSQGLLSARIISYVSSDSISFKLDGVDSLRIHNDGVYGLIREDGSGDLGDRIQYINNALGFAEFDPLDPITCQIFYDGRRIDHIRFAMTVPDRIIEFYGSVESFDGTARPDLVSGKRLPSLKNKFIEDLAEQYRCLLKENTVNLAIIDHQMSTIAFCLRKYLDILAMVDDTDQVLRLQVFKDVSSLVSQYYPIFAGGALDDARNWYFTVVENTAKAEVFIRYYYGQIALGRDIDCFKLMRSFNLV